MRSAIVRCTVFVTVLAVVLSGCAPRSSRPDPAPIGRPSMPGAAPGSGAAAAYRKLPLPFVENQGQLDERVAYSVSTRGLTAYFTTSGITYGIIGHRNDVPAAPEIRRGGRLDAMAALASAGLPDERWVVAADFVGANPASQPQGFNRAEGIVSYFKGSPDQWKTGLPTFAGVVYPDLWPGIDLVYGQQAGQLKYSFVVQPGADPRQIQLGYRGATNARVDERGQLVLATSMGDLIDGTPSAFQDGDGEPAPVDVAFALTHDADLGLDLVGFQPGAYDPDRPLVIDPIVGVVRGAYVGGKDEDIGDRIAVDRAGNAYITGVTGSSQASFPVTVGPDLTFAGSDLFFNYDAFVAKISADGQTLVYCGYIGGSGLEFAFDIAVDGEGGAYVAGITSSDQTTFPVHRGPSLTFSGGILDAYIVRIDPTGKALVYAGYIGGNDQDGAYGVTVDSSGNAYVVGTTASTQTTFPAHGGPDSTYNGGEDGFVAKVRSDGQLLLAGYVGGSGDEQIFSVAVDSSQNMYVTGITTSSQATFPVVIGPDTTYNGATDAFVTKIGSDGRTIVYSGYIGGNDLDQGFSIAVDTSGNAYVSGGTASHEDSFPVRNGPDKTYNGGDMDAFVAKVRPDGKELVYCGYIGGNLHDEGNWIDVDPDGSAYVAGYTLSNQATFPVLIGPDLTYNGGEDGFVAKVRTSDGKLLFAGYIGGGGDDRALGIAVNPSNRNAYVSGRTSSDGSPAPAPPLTGGFDSTYNGGTADAFVLRMKDDVSPTGTFSLAPASAQADVRQPLSLKLTWTVPDPERWTDLATIQVRFRDDKDVIMQLQWDQQANTFQLVDPDTGKLGPPASPGSTEILRTPRVELSMAETRAKGGGPLAPNVDLTLGLAFQPPTKGRTFAVEVGASDDLGASQGFEAAGTVTVAR